MPNFLLFFFSLATLLLGANYFVNYSVKLARRLCVSPLVIGATAVAIGTSIPEVAVAINASLVGKGGLVTGNIIGANVANAGLILGLAFLSGKIRVGTKKTQVLSRLMVLTGGLFTLNILLFENISRFWAAAFLVFTCGIFFWVVYAGKRGSSAEDAVLFKEKNLRIESLPLILFVVILSLIAVYLSGQLFVSSALALAEFFQVQASIIGLTIVSLGTTLPELTTVLVAAFRKEEKLILGNIVGSIIYNFLLVGGLGGLIFPLPSVSFSPLLLMFLAIALLAFLIRFYQGKIIPRFWGAILVLSYLIFFSLSL